ETMSLMIRKLSTGDTIVFDQITKDLFVIDAKHTPNWDNAESPSVTHAKQMVERGEARYFDRKTLELVNQVLVNIALLEAGLTQS
ncbi:MAG TPA: hypothetical protein VEP90_26815, partial [Methylomirabilota bacterium]|nr:hypothetical protein [Methylomirabilota bacterium]